VFSFPRVAICINPDHNLRVLAIPIDVLRLQVCFFFVLLDLNFILFFHVLLFYFSRSTICIDLDKDSRDLAIPADAF
jgi:hypothetical protein